MGGGVALPTGTVTFLFTDLVGSTRLWERYPSEMPAALARHDEIVRSAIGTHGGYVFATGGDGFAAAFAGALDAVDAAALAQRGLGAEVWPEGMMLSARMGVHSGEAQERDGDYFGPTLNRVGRLHAIGHGGQILVSDTTESLVRDRVELRDLGRFQLRDLDDAAPVFQLVGDDLDSEFPALRTLDSAAHNLPLAVDDFVGRERELRGLIRSLRESRLVTLTGVGGTGKTRLALEAAALEVGRFSDGVWLVQLAAVTEAAAVPFVVADDVGAVQQDGLSMVESLVRSLSPRNVLLVLDNCEHLLDEVAELVSKLVAKCPKLVVLATSREGLAVRGERILATPSLTSEEGVQLFLARATAAGAVVDESGLDAVAEVVERLDGLPLAIELAAARRNALSVKEISGRLDDRFRLLRGGGRGRRERHQTLWNTVAWSYDLLTEAEQNIFDRLSVFAGGFTMDAARGICSSEFDAFDVEDAVIAFVERSLVVAESTSSGTRYKVLETLRQFGEAQLGDETGTVRDLHAMWFADFAERALVGVGSPAGIDWNRRQLAEIDNLRAVVYGTHPDAACRVVSAMGLLWWLRLDYEYVDWALQVLKHDGEGKRRTQGLLQGLLAAQNAGRRTDADQIRTEVEGTGLDRSASILWLSYLVMELTLEGRPEDAFDLPGRLLELALSLDGYNRVGWVHMASTQSIVVGDFATARQIWEHHADTEFRQFPPAAECAGRFHYGRYLAAVKESGARAQFEKAADLASQFDWPLFEHVALSELGAALAAEGEFEAARPRLAEAIRKWIQAGDIGQLWVTLHHVADFLAKLGERALAEEVWAQLRDRPGHTSTTQRLGLTALFGEPPAPTMTDDELLAWSTDLAGHLAS